MSNIRRCFIEGYPYFLTSVTYKRQPILVQAIDLFRSSMNYTQHELPFGLIAWVVLPDHFHILIEPRGQDISRVMQRLKLTFAGRLRHRLQMASGRVWQLRFWDRGMRNEEELNRHLDYIHYNPVKHGWSHSPAEWEHSSFHDFVKAGFYDPEWGRIAPRQFDGEFGE